MRCCASTRLWPPFNNLKARQAVAHAMSQKDYMSAAYGDPKLWHECYRLLGLRQPERHGGRLRIRIGNRTWIWRGNWCASLAMTARRWC